MYYFVEKIPEEEVSRLKLILPAYAGRIINETMSADRIRVEIGFVYKDDWESYKLSKVSYKYPHKPFSQRIWQLIRNLF